MIPFSSLDDPAVRIRRRVYQLTRRRGLRHEDAEDVAQDVLYRLWRGGLLSRAEGSSLVPTVARRALASFLRRELAARRDRRRRVPLEALDAEAPFGDRGAAAGPEERHQLERAARELGEDPKIRALLLRLEGWSYRDIAATLGTGVGDVTNYLHRAKRLVRSRVRTLDDTG
jgi:RNA polymerase sigma factor (sigma-70 family)